MAVYTQVSAEALADFLTRYDVGELVSAKGIAEGVENSNYLVDTTGHDGAGARFILTLYEKRVSADDLPFFLDLLDHLAAAGAPVPPAIRDRQGIAIQTLAGHPACLIRFLTGVSVTHPTPAQAHAAAAAMGRMHAALSGFTGTRENTLGVAAWRPLLDRCGDSLDTIAPGLHAELVEALDSVLARWPTTGATSVVHADLFPDNVLMLGDSVTGLIDFYFACTDLRLYDLAVMHTAWAFDPSGEMYDRALGDRLLAGYVEGFGRANGWDEEERMQLPVLCEGACLRFALTRAWDWLNTPADALVTRKDPLAYVRRLRAYRAGGREMFA